MTAEELLAEFNVPLTNATISLGRYDPNPDGMYRYAVRIDYTVEGGGTAHRESPRIYRWHDARPLVRDGNALIQLVARLTRP